MDAVRMLRRGGTAARIARSCAARAVQAGVRVLLDEGIDFVGDPVIGHDEGQEGADDEEDDPGAFPESGEGGVLHGQVDEVGGAVEDVGDQTKEAELQQAFEREGGAEVRPGGEGPSDGDGSEDDVIEDAARLPEARGVGEGGAEFGEGI